MPLPIAAIIGIVSGAATAASAGYGIYTESRKVQQWRNQRSINRWNQRRSGRAYPNKRRYYP